MAKYLIQGSFSSDGLQGLMKEGGTSRREAIATMLAEIGGSLEAFYFGFGTTDVFVLADAPDNITAAAVGMTIGATGAVATNTIVLLTPEEIDTASKKAVPYRAPGR
jgi:uncharacterized protein with GYD domain